MIIKHIENTTGKSITRKTLWNIRQRLKRESYKWYSELREGEYEYLHEFKERINEIMDLQNNTTNYIRESAQPFNVQTSLLNCINFNITLSNYFDVAPAIGINTLPAYTRN